MLLIILLTLRMIDVAITILIMEKCYDLFYWRRWVRQLPNKPGNDYHSATQQKYFRENHYLLINIFARRRPFAIKKRLSSSQKKILSLRLSLISSFYVETINKRRKSPRKWIIHYLRGISISIFYHSPGMQVYWCFILTESHFLDGSISDWKKSPQKISD